MPQFAVLIELQIRSPLTSVLYPWFQKLLFNTIFPLLLLVLTTH